MSLCVKKKLFKKILFATGQIFFCLAGPARKGVGEGIFGAEALGSKVLRATSLGSRNGERNTREKKGANFTIALAPH